MYKTIISWIKRERWMLVATGFMAFLVILPQVLFPIMSGASYRGLNVGNYGDDDTGYLSKGREIFQGNPLGNVTMAVGKDGPDPHHVYVEYLFLLPLRALGLADSIDIVVLYTIMTFIAVWLLMIVIGRLVYAWSNNHLLAATVPLAVVGGYTFLLQYPIRASPFTSDLSIFGRPVMPTFGVLAFFISLYCLDRSLLQMNNRRWLVAAGVSLGALFYTYFYAWSFAFAVLGVLGIIALVLRDWQQMKHLACIGAIALAVGSYIIFQIASFFTAEANEQLRYFSGFQFGRDPLAISKIMIAALILWGVYAYRERGNERRWLFLALLLAGWVALNQQILTGRYNQPLHYFWYFILPTVMLTGVYMLAVLLRPTRLRYLLPLGFIVFMLASYANTAVRHYRAARITFPLKQSAQRYGPIITELKRASSSSVILTSDRWYGGLIPVYTNHDVFWDVKGLFGASETYMVNALYVYAALAGVPPAQFAEHVTTIAGPERGIRPIAPVDTSREIYVQLEGLRSASRDGGDYAKRRETNDPALLAKRQEILARLKQGYEELYKDPDGIRNVLKAANVSYIIWDKGQQPEWNLSLVHGLRAVTSSQDVVLYSVSYGQ